MGTDIPKSETSEGVFGRLQLWLNSFSYTTRVTVTFALVAVMTAIIAMGVLSFVWEANFQEYTRENVQALADSTANSIATHYESNHDVEIRTAQENGTDYPRMTTSDLQAAQSVSSLQRGMGVQVVSYLSGRSVFDSSQIGQNEGLFVGDDPHNGSLAPSSDDTVAASPIMLSDGTVIGSVRMWVYGSEMLLSKTDQAFRQQSYQAMMFAALIATALACVIGFGFARALVNPITRMTRTAAQLRDGNLDARTNFEGTDEIAVLARTFDAMADNFQRSQKRERQLTTDVAHELRTPLMAIRSTVEAIQDGVFEADEERLGIINEEVQRLSRLVDAILKLSRLENGSIPMNEQAINVGELVRPLVMSHEAFVADAGLDLEFEAEDDVFIFGDRDMIRQATANLISNAVRYTPEPGKIAVVVRKDERKGEALIAVRDTGIGLTEEEARMVFERFWRAEESRERQSGGLGIGLSVVKEIINRHSGWVEVEGEKGVGACFTLHIPLYDYERIKSVKEKREHGENAGVTSPIHVAGVSVSTGSRKSGKAQRSSISGKMPKIDMGSRSEHRRGAGRSERER
ncbi:MAG: HAMP domain-containing sensor histidine kinase [Eggerthellales bacterium]|nr:HAMP domain-containing sensor histidine kinase [Eggerthellales bacterium]